MKGCHAGVTLALSDVERARFPQFVEQCEAGCWQWTGCKTPDGYGRFTVGGKSRLAHRVAYVLAHGPITRGSLVMHSCDNPSCVNPEHLWAGTQADNLRDMRRKGRQRRGKKNRRSVCVSGRHAMEGDNIGIRRAPDGRESRFCVACHNEWLESSGKHLRRIANARRRDAAAAEMYALVEKVLPESRVILEAICGSENAAVLCMNIGLFGAKPMTLEDIGAALGFTRERARQRCNAALKQLGITPPGYKSISMKHRRTCHASKSQAA